MVDVAVVGHTYTSHNILNYRDNTSMGDRQYLGSASVFRRLGLNT